MHLLLVIIAEKMHLFNPNLRFLFIFSVQLLNCVKMETFVAEGIEEQDCECLLPAIKMVNNQNCDVDSFSKAIPTASLIDVCPHNFTISGFIGRIRGVKGTRITRSPFVISTPVCLTIDQKKRICKSLSAKFVLF